VKEKRKGPISIAGGFVDSVAATVRRMQRDREPRALAYDPTGYARLIQPEARGHERILEIAEEMVTLAAQDGGRAARETPVEEPEPPRRPRPKSERAKPAKARAPKASGAGTAKAAGKTAKRAKGAAKASRSRTTQASTSSKSDSAKPRKPRARRASRPKES
jgi:hypothetical protein